MNHFDKLPKNVKKTVRYIKQDATEQQLNEIKKLINVAINKRLKELGKAN